ncbi:MAG: RNA polymerase sigma factor, partial [Candidatus Roizmanbacteria bacterium GW2011_GWC2_35_12]
MTDEKLVEKICREDKELYTEIVNRYQEKLLRYASNLIGDKYKASEIVQESFIKAYISLRSFNTKKKFSSWIYRIVHNETMNYFQKYKKEVPIKEEMNLTSKNNIEEYINKKEIIEKANKCLSKIPVTYSE